jgi:tRNA-specific 2-thiouridylase
MPDGACRNASACYGPGEEADVESAKRICEELGIRHLALDLSAEYKREVLGSFKKGYLNGLTPNPCVLCNRSMKFGILIDAARAAGLDFDRFATGHYARVSFDAASGLYELRRALDMSKDQSYFLSGLSQERLSLCEFPLGSMLKSDVFAIAREAGWTELAAKPESQDFIEGEYASLFDAAEMSKGPIIDASGRVVGVHNGLPNYTVGQRKGLGVGGLKEPFYVIGKDAASNTLIVGLKDELAASGVRAARFNWVSCAPRTEPFRAQARLRSSQRYGVESEIRPSPDGSLTAIFSEPQFAVAPGQTLALYDGDVLLGGGEMAEAIR